jgi:hypothetical protein
MRLVLLYRGTQLKGETVVPSIQLSVMKVNLNLNHPCLVYVAMKEITKQAKWRTVQIKQNYCTGVEGSNITLTQNKHGE